MDGSAWARDQKTFLISSTISSPTSQVIKLKQQFAQRFFEVLLIPRVHGWFEFFNFSAAEADAIHEEGASVKHIKTARFQL